MQGKRVVLMILTGLGLLQLAAYENKDIIIAYDLHGVLFDLDIPQLMPTIAQELWRAPLMPFRLLKNVCTKKGNIFSEPGVRKMANCQRPIPATWHFIEELKKAEHPLYIFSNINEPTYQELYLQHTEKLALFDGVLSVPDGKKKWKKPSKTAYKRFHELLAHHGHALSKQPVIFVDNKPENIAAARRHGLIGVLFITPQQAAADVKKHIALLTGKKA